MPGPVPGRGGGGSGRHVVKSYLPTSTIMRKIDGADCSCVQFFFRLVAPPLQQCVIEPYLIRGVGLPNRLSLEGVGRIP
jgi:hypothetical protein